MENPNYVIEKLEGILKEMKKSITSIEQEKSAEYQIHSTNVKKDTVANVFIVEMKFFLIGNRETALHDAVNYVISRLPKQDINISIQYNKLPGDAPTAAVSLIYHIKHNALDEMLAYKEKIKTVLNEQTNHFVDVINNCSDNMCKTIREVGDKLTDAFRKF